MRLFKHFIDVLVHVASARAPDPPEVMSERRLSGAKTIPQTSDHAGEVIAEFMCICLFLKSLTAFMHLA